MKRPLFWKLCLVLAVGTVLLFWLIAYSLDLLERQQSMLSSAARQQLLAYRDQAQQLHQQGDQAALERWLAKVSKTEQSWLTVAKVDVSSAQLAQMQQRFSDGFILGRSIDWPIHLHLAYNPIMDLPFADGNTRLLIELPARLRPGMAFRPVKLVLQFVLPLSVMLLASLLLYRHLMQPLRLLQQTADQLSRGQLDSRARPLLGNRQDEFSRLAEHFDQMAAQIAGQIQQQRQFIADMSHELRTPLARIGLALDCASARLDPQLMLNRIQADCAAMQQLVDNALTLAWLDNEQPQPAQERFYLDDLLDVLLENARFEFPDRQLTSDWPADLPMQQGSPQLLGQALENLLRNALRHTPPGGTVQLQLQRLNSGYQLSIRDQGPGVSSSLLPLLGQPFFRLPGSAKYGQGFGLGLALAKRQISAAGGRLQLTNIDNPLDPAQNQGLQALIWLPAGPQM
jgi:two-component system sensor histidine kinase PfeS